MKSFYSLTWLILMIQFQKFYFSRQQMLMQWHEKFFSCYSEHFYHTSEISNWSPSQWYVQCCNRSSSYPGNTVCGLYVTYTETQCDACILHLSHYFFILITKLLYGWKTKPLKKEVTFICCTHVNINSFSKLLQMQMGYIELKRK